MLNIELDENLYCTVCNNLCIQRLKEVVTYLNTQDFLSNVHFIPPTSDGSKLSSEEE